MNPVGQKRNRHHQAPHSWGFLFKGLEIDFDMHRYLVLLFLVGILKANGGETYISPGIQIGMNSKDNLFIFGQITFGFLIDDTVIGDAVPIGFNLGKRWYKMEKIMG